MLLIIIGVTMGKIHVILSQKEGGKKIHNWKIYLSEFLELTFEDFNQDIFNISLMDMAKFDPDLPIVFCNCKWHDEVRVLLKEQISDFRKGLGYEGEFSINYIPYDKMEFKQIKDINIGNEGNIYRFQGFVDAITGIYATAKYFFQCDTCQTRNISVKRTKKCQTCGAITNNPEYHSIKKTFREFEIKETYDYQTISESVLAKIELSENPNANIFDIQSMLNKRLDFLCILNFKEMTTGKLIPELSVIGIRDAKTNKLSDSRKKELDDFVSENEYKVLEILAENIFYGHKGDYWIKLSMLLCAVGLSQIDKNFDEHKSKQMILMWIGHVGSGKSNLINRLIKFLENSSDIGKNTSEAGLGGGSEKNQSGQFVFRMGELSRCNNGVLFCDEIGMWQEGVLNTVSQQMSDGKITYTKIIKTEQRVFMNYILCGNPPEGKFDSHKTWFENLGATPQINDRASIQIISKEPKTSEKKMKEIFKSTAGFIDEEKSQSLSNDFIKDIIKRIKDDYPNPYIDKNMIDYAMEKFMKVATQKPKNDEGYDTESRGVKSFHVRSWENFLRFIKAIGRFSRHETTTTTDVDFAWQVLYNASYKNLLRDYGSLDLSRYEFEEKAKLEKMMTEGEKPTNKNQLMRWIKRKIDKAPQNEIEIMELDTLLSNWDLSHLLGEALEILMREGVIMKIRDTDKIKLI